MEAFNIQPCVPDNPADMITDNIDIWTSAIKTRSSAGRGSSKKLNLYGVKKLRELILELAVRGKLVPQDASEGPTSVLLERIAAEKAQLVKDKKIKKPQLLPEITDDEEPFQLPVGWEWERLGNIGNIFNGNSVNVRVKEEKYSDCSGLPYIATKDIGYGFEKFDYDNGISIPIGEPKFKVARQGAVLVCAEGGSAGKKCGITQQDICFGNKLFANELYGGIEPSFVLSNYLSPTFFQQFNASMTGIIGGISARKFAELIIPLPSLSEQRRIVTKIDELMALCDQLEQQTEASIDAHATLVETLLTTLTHSADAAELDQNWTRIADHFDTLFTTDHSIDQLKQTVLQLAVMGKLVPQDPNDESAAALLDRLCDDIKQYSSENKITLQKPQEILSSDVPAKVPSGWQWARLCSVFRVITDGDHQAPPKSVDGVAFLTIGNISSGSVDFSGCRFVPQEYFDSITSYRKPSYGDILYTVVGATYGRALLVDSKRDFCVQRHIAILKCCPDFNVDFATLLLSSPFVYDQATKSVTGTAQPTVPLRPLRNFLIPIPPLNEQVRIVAKVDQLMILCDRLKERLQHAQHTKLRLADALVEQAVG